MHLPVFEPMAGVGLGVEHHSPLRASLGLFSTGLVLFVWGRVCLIGAQTVVARDGINLQRTITIGKSLIPGSVTRPFYEFGGTKSPQNFQTICKLLIYMLKDGGQGRPPKHTHRLQSSHLFLRGLYQHMCKRAGWLLVTGRNRRQKNRLGRDRFLLFEGTGRWRQIPQVEEWINLLTTSTISANRSFVRCFV